MLGTTRILGTVLAGTVATAALGDIIAVERHSYVLAFEHLYDLQGNYLGTVQDEHGSTSMDPFVSRAAAGGYTAIQDSRFDATTISVANTAFGTPASMGWGQGVSFFHLTFDLTHAATYSLEGTFARFIGNSFITLTGPGTNLVHDPYDYPAREFAYSGTLGPGRYVFEARAESDYGSLAATLTIIPSPSMPLVALASSALAASRRRRRAASPAC